MSRRCTLFERRPKDFYPTPLAAIAPLAVHLPDRFTFCEPCAGNGALIRHLSAIGGECVAAYDIEKWPRRRGAGESSPYIGRCGLRDALTLTRDDLNGADFIVTNPPWSRPLLHAMVLHFASLGTPTWLLFDAGWKETRQAAPFLQHVRAIQPIGRLRWIPGSPHTGKDDNGWHLIGPASETPARFHGRIS